MLVARAKVTFPAESNISLNRPWSHSALYVEPVANAAPEDKPNILIKANIDEGVASAVEISALSNPFA